MLRKFSIVNVIAICSINVFLIGINLGFGYKATETIEFSVSSESGYEFLTRCYIGICFWLIVFIIGKLIKNEVTSQTICISSLILTIFLYRSVYLQKSLYFINPYPITKVFRESMPLDLISFSLVMILLIYQIITVFQHYFDWKRNNARVK